MDQKLQQAIIRQFYKARIENRQNEFFHPPFQLEEKLVNAIQLGNTEEAIAALKEINKLERAKLAAHEVRSVKNSLIASCTLFTRAIIRGGVHPEIAYNLSDVLIRKIEQLNDVDQLNQFEIDMVYSFIHTLKSEQTPNYKSIVNKTIAYIHENILKDLSLQTIAEELYVSPSYLSTTFKKETGTTLTDYINRKRMEESKYFLLHTDLSISDIAHLFHFCNQSYYTNLFKKITGMTPKQFKEFNGVL
ncbi:AraC family transcriptional regulator [Fervidibacillus halotolerans]|uniref:AraC family transcriptional regulator n=1 Tax=Fervidibacillus halotolerans TaxID=2980027 RepID=A0A9E8LZ35_9BACI|nr:AraC family transcriptional regulator [Fervidibacillus halotolerans]WAA12229.1 AraC family transcriptional regulator [Fervidibacillus halotolerans]